MQTVTQSNFNAYDKNIQDTLLAQGFVVVDDTPVETIKPVVETTKPVGDLLAGLGDDEELEESGIFINVFVTKGNKRHKLTFAALDSDFVRFTDKEHTTENATRNAIVSAVDTVGIDKANEVITFEVELTKKGEVGEIDLLAE